jgi:hypothetical protein
MALTRHDRNQLFDAIKGAGLDMADCNSEVSGQAFSVRHVATGSVITVTEAPTWGSTTYDVTHEIPDGPSAEKPSLAWGEVMEEAMSWADEVHYIFTVPDLWAELEASRNAIAAVEAMETDNTPFTAEEHEQIAAAFAAAKEEARERYSLPEEQLASLEAKTDQLVEVSRTMNRKDWLNLVGSVGFTLIAGSLIPSDVVQHLLGLALRGIAHMFGVDLPALPG